MQESRGLDGVVSVVDVAFILAENQKQSFGMAETAAHA